MVISATLCPCGTGKALADCCGPLHRGAPAPDAEALMRSRYSAYVLELEPYLLQTWHPSTRPASLNLQAPPKPKWLGLEIVAQDAIDAAHASVEFIARFKVNGRALRLHERSRFTLEEGRWFYLDGTQLK